MANPERIENENIQKVKLIKTGRYYRMFFIPATDNGDLTGNRNMGIDGSVTPVKFSIKPPPGIIYYITRMMFYLQDAGSMDSGGWGNNGGVALTHGLLPYVKINNDTRLALPFAIKSHGDLSALTYDTTKHSWGQGDEFIVSRLSFTKLNSVLVLDGDKGDEWFVEIKDDLSYLKKQIITFEGHTNLFQ